MGQDARSQLEEQMPVIDRIRALLPDVRAAAVETEQNGRVSAELLDRLEDAGAFRLCVPTCFGGEEASYPEVAEIIEEVAAADASTAWHLMVAAGSQVILSRIPLASQQQFYAHGADTWPKAAIAPHGLATAVPGGYRLSGRWPLASGARDFDWISVGFFVRDEYGMRKGANGQPELRVCLLPREDVKVFETWDAVGLRGTRSDDLELTDRFVPDAWQAPLRAPSKLNLPTVRISMPWALSSHHTSVVIGILGAAMADLTRAAMTRKPAFNPAVVMKDDPVFRSRFGELAARFDSLVELAHRNVAMLHRCNVEERDIDPAREGWKISAGAAFIHNEGTALMDQIMGLSGSSGVYMSNDQQRRWRDLRCVAQHQAAHIGSYDLYATALIDTAAAREARY